jgi:hypothetical protein
VGEVVTVGARTGHAAEQRARPHLPGVVHDRRDIGIATGPGDADGGAIDGGGELAEQHP